MTTPGLNLTDFNTTFPEFSTAPSALVTTFINLINNGYLFTQNNVTDATILGVYYWYLAHLVYISTQPITGNIAGGSGSYMPESQSAGLVSASFAQIKNLSIDQSFINSTRYGETFWIFCKQLYVQNFYINQSGYSCSRWW